MEQQKDWTEQLRTRLEHHQAAVPDDLWTGIEAALDAQEAKQRKARILVMRRRLAAAAVVCAVAVGSIVYLRQHPNEAALAERPSQTALVPQGSAQLDKTNGSEADDGSAAQADDAPLLASLPGKIAHALRQVRGGATVAGADLQHDLGVTVVESVLTDKQAQTDEANLQGNSGQAEKAEKTAKKAPAAQPSKPSWTVGEASRGRRSGSNRLTLALAASGTFAQGTTTDAPTMMQAPLYFNDMVANSAANEVSVGTNYEEKKHHNQPVSLGLSVSYSLSDRLSVASGLVYTWATSEFTYGLRNSSQQETQTLRYVGVPLKASYVVWKNRWLKTYASVGGQADFCVSATVDSDGGKSDIDKDRAQLSTQASVGVEYDVVPEVGIYVEPGVKYYFDNGSRIENIFKDKPCRFDLQLGVRLNLGGNR